MTIVQERPRRRIRPVVTETTKIEGISVIREPDCPAAIWQRDLAPGFQAWIDTLDPDLLPRARVILRPEDIRDATAEIYENSNTPTGPERDFLTKDTAALARVFAKLMQTPFLRLRFDVVSTNACRKFHIDTVTARLICTYRGSGTQYGFSMDDGTLAHVASVPTGAPFLLRGKLWQENPDAGLRHRSPQIEGTGETRLVLVLDPIADPDAHSDQKFRL